MAQTAIKEQFILNENGEKTAVILDIKYYEKILEDIHDLRLFEERQDEAEISFTDLDK